MVSTFTFPFIAVDQYILVVLKKTVEESATVQMNGILRALFWGTVYYDIKVVLLFESGDKILKGDHTNESY